MELIKKDIDEAIENAVKYQDFVDELGYKGYFVKKSNNSISILTPYFNRNIRIARAFGEDYIFENIKHRIYYNDYRFKNDSNKTYKVKIYDGIKINSELLKTSHFYRLYVHFLYCFLHLLAELCILSFPTISGSIPHSLKISLGNFL